MRLLKPALAALISLSAATLWAQKAPVNALDYAPADSEVVLLANVHNLTQQGIVKKVLDQVQSDPEQKRQLDAKIAVLQNLAGINPLEDIDAIGIWGKMDQPDSFGVKVTGKFDQQKLLALLRLNKDFEETSGVEGLDIPIFQWRDKGKEGAVKYGTFLPDGSPAVFSSKKALEQALEAKKSGKNFMSVKAPGWTPPTEIDKNFVIWAYLLKPQNTGKFKDTLQANYVIASVRFTETEVFGSLTVAAASAEAAQRWVDMFKGAVALARLQSSDENLKKIADTATTELDSTNNFAKFQVGLPNDLILAGIKKHQEAKPHETKKHDEKDKD